MPKKQYKCEVCGKRNYIGNVVCCNCVERDLLKLNDSVKIIEKRLYGIEMSIKELRRGKNDR